MLRFITSRLLQSLLALFLVITATFFMIRFVPGGPFTAEKAVTPEILRNLEAHYGLDRPLWRQYLDYLGSLGRGDLGPSFKYPNRTVNEIIGDKLPVSAELGALALAFALVIGITLGTLAAVYRNTWIDYVASTFGMMGISIPTFVVGPLLVLGLAIHLGWFNASGWYGPADRVLPAIVLGFAYAAPVSRLTRGGMLEILGQDFIRTARAKGASELRIITRHALRGGLLPVVSFLGPAVAGILTGSFVIETIFQIPGIGREFVNSAFNRDYTLVLGTVILYAVLIMALNLVVDIVQAWMNPKVRLEG
ncbi:MAG: ABC transporter permease subunit [Verrucomicrobia bacterium]|jgi:oligopeptide transport system permease protein|nr:ABC transporter permease subunit [Verrucomicrobiota bacterium]